MAFAYMVSPPEVGWSVGGAGSAGSPSRAAFSATIWSTSACLRCTCSRNSTRASIPSSRAAIRSTFASVRSIASWWSNRRCSPSAPARTRPRRRPAARRARTADGVPRRADQVPPQRPERHHRCGGTNQDLGRVAAEELGRHQAAICPYSRSSDADIQNGRPASRTPGGASPARRDPAEQPVVVGLAREEPHDEAAVPHPPARVGWLASFPTMMSMRNTSGSGDGIGSGSGTGRGGGRTAGTVSASIR